MNSAKTKVPNIAQTAYIDVQVETVYATLTTADGWNAWFTKETTLDPKVGGEFVMRWRNWHVKHVNAEAVCEIVEMVPNSLFKFKWPSHGLMTTVSFTLTPHATGTIVELVETGYDSSEEGIAGLVDCAGGWGEAIVRLKMYLEHGITYGVVPG